MMVAARVSDSGVWGESPSGVWGRAPAGVRGGSPGGVRGGAPRRKFWPFWQVKGSGLATLKRGPNLQFTGT